MTAAFDPAAEIPAVPGLQNGRADLALRAAERIFVRLVAAQEVVFGKAVFDGVANTEGVQDHTRWRPVARTTEPTARRRNQRLGVVAGHTRVRRRSRRLAPDRSRFS